MRILLVSPFVPDPLGGHGGGIALAAMIEGLQRAGAAVALVAFRHDDAPAGPAGVATQTVPLRRNAELTSTARLARRARLAIEWGLRGMPLVAAKHRSAAFAAALARSREDFGPDVVLIEFAVMAQYLAHPALGDLVAVLTDHEQGGAIPADFDPFGWGAARDRRLWRRYVARYYPLATQCQALTAPDAEHLRARTGLPVAVRGPSVPLPARTVDPGAARPVVLFFGDYRHHPNPEAARRLAEQIWPEVHGALPEAELWLAGPNPTPAVQALAGRPGVRVLGFFADLEALLAQVRCVAAPVYSGGGVRTKVMTAFSFGLPVIANALGLQGLDPPPASVRTGEAAAALAQACLVFLRDPVAARAGGVAARAYATRELGADVVAARQLTRLEELCGRR